MKPISPDMIPSVALPNTVSSTGNVHRLIEVNPNLLLLEPGPKLWRWALISVAFFPVCLGVAWCFHLDRGFTFFLGMAPFLAGGGFAVGAYGFKRLGTRVQFDRSTRLASITGFRHRPGRTIRWDEIQAIQFCDAGRRVADSGSWHAYQVNLVLAAPELSRINLLDTADQTELRQIAERMALFLRVPFVGPVNKPRI